MKEASLKHFGKGKTIEMVNRWVVARGFGRGGVQRGGLSSEVQGDF